MASRPPVPPVGRMGPWTWTATAWGTWRLRKVNHELWTYNGGGDPILERDRSLEQEIGLRFIFIDTDNKEGSGFTKTLPGLNVAFAPADAWDKCVILSPQPQQRVVSEAETKAGWAKDAVVVPLRTRGAGRTISGSVALKDLGAGDPAKWGYQVVVQSNEGFPDKADLLTRKVNEFEGQHRFGGGNDGDCDPHAMDVLAGKGTGDKSEIEEQYKMLAYECEADGTSKKMATLSMIRK